LLDARFDETAFLARAAAFVALFAAGVPGGLPELETDQPAAD
jgi:hypothetical protein